MPTDKYTISAPGPIASYDFFDIAEGTGRVNFYGAMDTSDSTTSYILTTAQVFSQNKSTGSSGGSGTIDLDFDVNFNLPKNIKGNCFVSLTIGAVKNAGQGDILFNADIKRVRDGVETSLGDRDSATYSWDNNTDSKTFLVKIPINSVEHFKKGDILRLTILMTFSTPGGGSFSNIQLSHDPQNRTSGITGDNYQLILNVPFIISQ